MKRRAASVALAGLIGIVAVSAALAANTHTVNEWYHGIGDGNNANYYIHPFNDSTYSHQHTGNEVIAWNDTTGARYGPQSCYCYHSHIDIDTNPWEECRFSSSHSVEGTSGSHSLNTGLNYHKHYHHDYCA
jgi:hypothetical protein